MARYIDADKIVDIIKMDIKQCEIDVSESCGDEFYEMAVNSRSSAMYSILREIESTPTTDVVPKSEVEKLKQLLNEECDACIGGARKKVAREIFEEIDLIHKKVFVDVAKMNLGDLEKAVLHEYFKLIGVCTNALKKKYTEGEVNARG